MNPVALRSHHSAYPLPSDHAPGGWVVIGPEHTYHKLDAVAAHVYTHADGTRDVAALAQSLVTTGITDADENLVHEALDRLADFGLLEKRVAPPAGVSRRVLLQRLAGGTALAALTAALGVPRTADAATAGLCGAERDLIDEIAYLEAQEGAVADLLDTWADALDKDEKADPFYAEALRSKEMEHKKRQQDYSVKLDDATDDLNACRVDRKIAKEETYKQQQQLKLKVRAQEADKKRQQQQEKFVAREADVKNAEDTRKKAIDSSKASEEKQKLATEASLTHEAQRLDRLKKLKAQEEDAKRQRSMRLDEQTAKKLANSEAKFISAEEGAKVLSEAYVLRAEEAAQKQLGQTDYALTVAKEENQKAWDEAPVLRKAEESAKEQYKKGASADYLAKEQEQKKADAIAQEQATKVQ